MLTAVRHSLLSAFFVACLVFLFSFDVVENASPQRCRLLMALAITCAALTLQLAVIMLLLQCGMA